MRGDPGMNSYNHYAYGAVAEWIYRYAAGLDTDVNDPGFHGISLDPQFDSRLGSLEVSYQSPYGMVSSSWLVKGETVQWNITIPPNTSARLSLTPEENGRFKIQGKSLSEQFSNAKQGENAGRLVYTIPAGSFSFVARQPSSPSADSTR
jgi:alpha-L-rhamnosidase